MMLINIFEDESLVDRISDEFYFNIKEILQTDDELVFYFIDSEYGIKRLSVNFLVPHLSEELRLDNLITSTLFLIVENKLFILSNKRIDFIDNILRDIHIISQKNFLIEVILKILEAGFNLITNELRSLRKKIDTLEASVLKSGSIKPVFSDLLTLQKYMITLSSTYNSNKQVVDFLRRHFKEWIEVNI